MRIVSTLILVALSALAPSARALAFWKNNPPTDPTASAVARDLAGVSAYDRLNTAKVTSLATEQPVLLTDAWRNREFLPFRNQRCVVEFLRHFGWVFCWERAAQLKRDVLPALQERDIPLVVVGIGSLESARTFCEQLDFPPGLLYVDTSEETSAYEAIGTRNSQKDPATGKQVFEGIESMWSSSTTDAIQDRGRDDLNSIVGKPFRPGPYKPLMPTSTEATLVQGASFVFDGQQTLLEHYDESSGAHVTIEELLEAALA